MIPLRDANPSSTTPFVTWSLIGVNIAVFLLEISGGREGVAGITASLGLVPSEVTDSVAGTDFRLSSFLPFITSIFLHGGWMHLIGNMWFLRIFGDNVEDRFGKFRFIVFYLFAGLAAGLLQVLVNPHSSVPMIGASGAIAGVLGAYIVMFPSARVTTLIPIIIFFQIVDLPAVAFLGIWFLIQAFSAYFSLGLGGDAGGVAWWAHIGGFAAGVILTPVFRIGRH